MHDPDVIQLLRLYVDGELESERQSEAQALIASSQHLQAFVAFERSLRSRVGAAMEAQPPVDVRESVAASLTECRQDTAGTVEALEAAPAPKPRGWFDGPRRANLLAVAAVLALITGAVLLGIFGPRIDDQPGGSAVPSPAEQVDRFVAEEHDRCASGRALDVSVDSFAAGQDFARRIVGRDVGIADLTQFGFEFRGVRQCELPGTPNAAHIMYVRRRSEGYPALLSIFAAPDDGQFDSDLAETEPGQVESTPRGPNCSHEVFRATDDQVIYFFVCCDDVALSEIVEDVADQVTGAAPVR